MSERMTMPKVYADVRVEGNEEDVRAFLRLCATIGWLCGAGASRRIPVEVDGDGSGDLRFAVTTQNGTEPLSLPVAPNIDRHEMAPVYIGE